MPTTPGPNFVYLAHVKGTDVYKVGVSSDPKRRVSDFGPPCELVHTVETGHTRKVESELLDRFSDHVTEGEWMECSDSVLPRIVGEMDRLRENSPPPTSGEVEPQEPLPPLSDGEAFSYSQIQRHSHQLAKDDPRTYAEIAEALDVTEGAVAKAVTTAGPKFHQLQARIVELLSDYTVERREAFVLHPND